MLQFHYMKTYNIELIFESETHFSDIKQFLIDYNNVFNECSKMIFDDRVLSLKYIHHKCYYILREKFSNLPSQTIIRAQKEVLATYKAIKSNKHKIDKPPVRKNFSIQLDKRLYSNYTISSIKITNPMSAGKRITVNFKLYNKVNEMFEKYEVCDPTIFYKNGKIYLSAIFETPVLVIKDLSVLGLDRGLRREVVDSDGNLYHDKDWMKQKRKIRYLKRCLQSKGTKSAKRKLKKIKNKEKNINNDHLHKITNKILKTNKSILVLEDLKKLKENTKKDKITDKKKIKHNNRISQFSFYRFKEILTYKALSLGKRVETVSPYMTSQLDCRANVEKGIRKGCRYLTSDGKVFDADWNAAINIARKFHPFSFELPLDGKLKRQAVCQSANRSESLLLTTSQIF